MIVTPPLIVGNILVLSLDRLGIPSGLLLLIRGCFEVGCRRVTPEFTVRFIILLVGEPAHRGEIFLELPFPGKLDDLVSAHFRNLVRVEYGIFLRLIFLVDRRLGIFEKISLERHGPRMLVKQVLALSLLLSGLLLALPQVHLLFRSLSTLLSLLVD